MSSSDLALKFVIQTLTESPDGWLEVRDFAARPQPGTDSYELDIWLSDCGVQTLHTLNGLDLGYVGPGGSQLYLIQETVDGRPCCLTLHVGVRGSRLRLSMMHAAIRPTTKVG